MGPSMVGRQRDKTGGLKWEIEIDVPGILRKERDHNLTQNIHEKLAPLPSLLSILSLEENTTNKASKQTKHGLFQRHKGHNHL